MKLLSLLTDLESRPSAVPYTAEAYDLKGFIEWLDTIGNPQQHTPWIHIAGTKGKGSTSALVESILRAAGLSTGLFTSPHLKHYGQRYRFNGVPWSLEEFAEGIERVSPAVSETQISRLAKPRAIRTAFEVLTAVAFSEFRDRKVEAGILEVGMGGRLDCTNAIADPVVCAITSIGLDHTAILGDTIELIAAEKAGILKPGRPVVVFNSDSAESERARSVIESQARELNCPIIAPVSVHVTECRLVGQRVVMPLHDGDVVARLPLVGDHQAHNLGIAVAVAQEFCKHQGIQLTNEAIIRGIEQVDWPGRFEVHPGRPMLILDGAHCPMSAGALGRTLAALQHELPTPAMLLWGMQADKDHAQFLDNLLRSAPAGMIRNAVCFRVAGGRGAESSALAAVARRAGLEVLEAPDSDAALRIAMNQDPATIVVAGSLYPLAGIAATFHATT